MNEEIEYAEMLEIPVSTVNVVRKKSPKIKRKTQIPFYPQPDLKENVISQINDKIAPPILSENTAETGEDTPMQEPIPERIDTVRLFREDEHPYFEEMQGEIASETPLFPASHAERKLRKVLGIEFGVACALCGGIFLTNVFMPGSAINSFFRSLGGNDTKTDARAYNEFVLTSVVSDYTDVEMNLSQEGVLTFQKECHVYPAVEGEIVDIIQNDGGMYTLKIAHSDTFTGVIEGLSQVYYSVGESVKANVPVGYSNGESVVQYTMYHEGELLNCFEITDDNGLSWTERELILQEELNVRLKICL